MRNEPSLCVHPRPIPRRPSHLDARSRASRVVGRVRARTTAPNRAVARASRRTARERDARGHRSTRRGNVSLIHFRFDSFAFERRWGRRPMVTRRRLCARRRTRARWSVDGSTSDGGSRDGGWRVGRARASARRRRGDDDAREDDDGWCSRKNRVRRKNWIWIRNRWARGRREGRRCREWEGGRRRWSRLRRRVRRFERL